MTRVWTEPVVPSGKVDATRMLASGMLRYASALFRESWSAVLVSSRKLSQK